MVITCIYRALKYNPPNEITQAVLNLAEDVALAPSFIVGEAGFLRLWHNLGNCREFQCLVLTLSREDESLGCPLPFSSTTNTQHSGVSGSFHFSKVFALDSSTTWQLSKFAKISKGNKPLLWWITHLKFVSSLSRLIFIWKETSGCLRGGKSS